MKILITGGAGFIGSHLTQLLLSKNHHVTIIDDLSTGSIDNISSYKEHPNFKYQIDSIVNKSISVELIDSTDVIIHLAAAVGVKLIIEKPVKTIETNVHGTEIILEIAARKGKRTIIASTSEVYGKSTHVPFKEEDDLLLGSTYKFRWSYACSKMLDEFLALAYHKEHQLPVTIIRFFNTVGPRQVSNYGMVIPNFIQQALRNDPITVFGTGEQKRCFCSVFDVVAAIESLIECTDSIGKILNVGSKEEVSINKLAEQIKKIVGSDSPIQKISYDDAYEKGFEDIQRRVPDISLISELISWKPKYSLDEIIKSVVEYESDILKAKLESVN